MKPTNTTALTVLARSGCVLGPAMNYEQKLEALNALSEAALLMRKPGDWYVQQHVEVKQGGILATLYGNGATPECAILDHWDQLVTNLPGGQYLVVHAAASELRQAVRWNGFMWARVEESR
jgi:hypothetical protein